MISSALTMSVSKFSIPLIPFLKTTLLISLPQHSYSHMISFPFLESLVTTPFPLKVSVFVFLSYRQVFPLSSTPRTGFFFAQAGPLPASSRHSARINLTGILRLFLDLNFIFSFLSRQASYPFSTTLTFLDSAPFFRNSVLYSFPFPFGT